MFATTAAERLPQGVYYGEMVGQRLPTARHGVRWGGVYRYIVIMHAGSEPRGCPIARGGGEPPPGQIFPLRVGFGATGSRYHI